MTDSTPGSAEISFVTAALQWPQLMSGTVYRALSMTVLSVFPAIDTRIPS